MWRSWHRGPVRKANLINLLVMESNGCNPSQSGMGTHDGARSFEMSAIEP